MRTPRPQLEDLIRQLAGRHIASNEARDLSRNQIHDDLNDSSSDASRFLEEIRLRTCSLFDDSTATQSISASRLQLSGPNRDIGPIRSVFKKFSVSLGFLLLSFGTVAVLLIAGVLFWKALDRTNSNRLSAQTEQILNVIRAKVGSRPQIAPLPDQLLSSMITNNELAMRRLEVELASLNIRFQSLSQTASLVATKADRSQAEPNGAVTNSTPAASPVNDANIPAINADLAAIRRELISSEAATTRQLQEMRTVLHEVNTVVRRVLNRPTAPDSNSVAVPILAVAVQALIHNLRHPLAQVRGEAVEQLVRLGVPARTALPALQQMLARETDPNIRSAIESALTVLSSN